YDDAVFVLQQAIAINPTAADLRNSLGLVLHAKRKPEDAAIAYRSAIELDPTLYQCYHNLATSLQVLGKLTEAEAAFRKSIEIKSDFAECYRSLGLLLQNQYRLSQAIECYEQALRIRPDYADAHSSLVIVKDFLAGNGSTDHVEERARWVEQQVEGRRITAAPPRGKPLPERKLKIGYVSADFQLHSASSGFGLMLTHYDRSQFEVVCYCNSPFHDDLTEKFRTSVDAWRVVYAKSDDALAEQIRADRIDILVDLSGHTAGNRLFFFSPQAATLQV